MLVLVFIDSVGGIGDHIWDDISFASIMVLALLAWLHHWRLDHFSFALIGLEEGEVLRFSKHSEVTCVVAGRKGEQVKGQRVVFEGREMSLSAAGRRAYRQHGYEIGRVRGSMCWEHDGRLLADLLQEIES